MPKFTDRFMKRIRELADAKMHYLRSIFPLATETQAELIRYTYDMSLKRGNLIEAILLEEFEGELQRADEAIEEKGPVEYID